MPRRKQVMTCRYNDHVDCEAPRPCIVCGWNPAVEKVRKGQLRMGFEIRPGMYETPERWLIGSGPFNDGIECHIHRVL